MSIPLPDRFKDRISQQFPDTFHDFLKALDGSTSSSILKHPFRKLPEQMPLDGGVAHSPLGYYLSERPSFVADPFFHAGHYYPQESSSMIIGHCMDQLVTNRSSLVLDLCAAPGGKSLHVLNHLNGSGLLVSNEPIRARNGILKENVTKWGFHNVVVTQNKGEQFAQSGLLFDCILIDAPCSGEGLFRKNHKSREEWSEEHVEFCSARQKSILMDTLPSLKSGGILIYSTCTYSQEENEENVRFLEKNGLKAIGFEMPKGTMATRVDKAWACHPHRAKGEGFFIAAFEKTEGESQLKLKEHSFRTAKDELSEYFNSTEVIVIEQADGLNMIPIEWSDVIYALKERLHVTQLGTPVGKMVRDKLHPDHCLSQSLLLKEGRAELSLDRVQALRYLRRETFDIQSADGWYIAHHQGAKLGWIKIAAGRMKNHFPKHLRIRKELRELS